MIRTLPAPRTIRPFLADFARGLFVGTLIWLLIGALISGATWRLYDIGWIGWSALLAITCVAWMVLADLRSR